MFRSLLDALNGIRIFKDYDAYRKFIDEANEKRYGDLKVSLKTTPITTRIHAPRRACVGACNNPDCTC